MVQIMMWIDDELVRQVDRLVVDGVVASRQDAVRSGLRILVEVKARQGVAAAIVEGYRRRPQGEGEAFFGDDMTRSMIAEEPWPRTGAC